VTTENRTKYAIEHVREDGPQRLLMGECDAGDGLFHNELRAQAFLAWHQKFWPGCELRLVYVLSGAL
jgi:hypothetical protein